VKNILLSIGILFFSGASLATEKLARIYSSEANVELSKERIVFHTNFGDIVAALYPKVAPAHSAQILAMSRAGVYDGAVFFRVEQGFVAQVENFDAKQVPLTAEQQTTVARLPAEFSRLKHRRGLLSMARFDDPNSAESSFSFMLGEAPHLDNQYTIFGEIVFGMNTLDSIDQVDVDSNHYPREDLRILSAEVIENGDFSQLKLREKIPLIPKEENQKAFALFAAALFFLTAGTPVYKALTQKN
jgi:cyclophilin family peptidyl-prolyl cis-trans isomerase